MEPSEWARQEKKENSPVNSGVELGNFPQIIVSPVLQVVCSHWWSYHQFKQWLLVLLKCSNMPTYCHEACGMNTKKHLTLILYGTTRWLNPMEATTRAKRVQEHVVRAATKNWKTVLPEDSNERTIWIPLQDSHLIHQHPVHGTDTGVLVMKRVQVPGSRFLIAYKGVRTTDSSRARPATTNKASWDVVPREVQSRLKV